MLAQKAFSEFSNNYYCTTVASFRYLYETALSIIKRSLLLYYEYRSFFIKKFFVSMSFCQVLFLVVELHNRFLREGHLEMWLQPSLPGLWLLLLLVELSCLLQEAVSEPESRRSTNKILRICQMNLFNITFCPET